MSEKNMPMCIKISVLFSLMLSLIACQDLSFTYNGFQSANISYDGIATITPDGLLRLTDHRVHSTSHAFFANSIKFKDSPNGTLFSFSTTFVFGIISEYANLSGHGMAFVIAPTNGLPGAFPGQYMGLFNTTNNGNTSNHVVAVEFDTIYNPDFNDINDNHVGIDINSLQSNISLPTAYYDDSKRSFENISLISGEVMQVWVEYDGLEKQMNVTIAPINVGKPRIPLISWPIDLSPIIKSSMFIGFSSATGSLLGSTYVLGWSFRMNSLQVEEPDISVLPKLPRIARKGRSILLPIGLPLLTAGLAVAAILGIVYFVKRKRKFAEELEDWELDYGPQRFKFKDLYIATKGFKDRELLGVGGFGKVYKGVLPTSRMGVAVKRISHDSRQGVKEFVAEVVSMGRLRHRNLVQLLGYCRRRGELLLVYEYMPNGSLDRYLYGHPRATLNWRQRFKVTKGIASGLFYLHEEWEQVVVHRDIKASNVLLDGELNGRLGDFGLARLYDHGSDPQTTIAAGTLGYLAPEQTRTGKATPRTDVYAFGAFLLEVACGRRPIGTITPRGDQILVEWVYSCYMRGDILEAKDPKLGTDYVAEEVELVLKLGLLCLNLNPNSRPSMRQVTEYLEGDVHLPELTSSGLTFNNAEGFMDFVMSYPSSMEKPTSPTSVAESLLSGSR